MREYWVEHDGVRLFAVEEGRGPALVMLHGGMASHVAVRPFVAPLSQWYRVITPDLRGSGKSWCAEPLTFNQFADDVALLLDHLALDQAVVGGISSGSGAALRFALRYPQRTLGLILIKPIYAGAGRGYTAHQKETFANMNAVASRVLDEGVQILRSLYADLPDGMREKALAMLEGFDPASVVATSTFIHSGAQPFGAVEELDSLRAPTLLVRGDDPLHPAEVSDLYAHTMPNCTMLPASTTEVTAPIGAFVERCQD